MVKFYLKRLYNFFCSIVKVVAMLQSNWQPNLKIMQGVNHKFIFVSQFVEVTVPWQDWK